MPLCGLKGSQIFVWIFGLRRMRRVWNHSLLENMSFLHYSIYRDCRGQLVKARSVRSIIYYRVGAFISKSIHMYSRTLMPILPSRTNGISKEACNSWR